jgi:hypothetical protein
MKTFSNIILSLLLLTAFAAADPAVKAISIDANSVQAGQSVTAIITLTEPAPAAGLQVELWTDLAASTPSYVFVPAGKTSATFAVSTSHVDQTTEINVAALQPETSVVSSFQLSPAPALTKK